VRSPFPQEDFIDDLVLDTQETRLTKRPSCGSRVPTTFSACAEGLFSRGIGALTKHDPLGDQVERSFCPMFINM